MVILYEIGAEVFFGKFFWIGLDQKYAALGGFFPVDVHVEMVEACQCDENEDGGNGGHEEKPHPGGKADYEYPYQQMENETS